MIRKATQKDVPGIVEMSRKFYQTTDFSTWSTFNEEHVRNLAAGLTDDHIMLIAEDRGEPVGMIGLFIIPFMFNGDHGVASEVVWYVNPHYEMHGIGKKLLEAAEQEANEADCSAILMISLATSPPQAKLMYEKMGYKATETVFTKVLKERAYV